MVCFCRVGMRLKELGSVVLHFLFLAFDVEFVRYRSLGKRVVGVYIWEGLPYGCLQSIANVFVSDFAFPSHNSIF